MISDMLAVFGHIDILVNNAGITKDNLMIKMSEDDFDAVIDTNLKGTFNTIKHMYRAFLKQRAGRIVRKPFRHCPGICCFSIPNISII